MHHMSRFFNKTTTNAAVDPKKSKPKPRLERRNARKYIDFDAPSTSSSFDDDSSPTASLVTRSLDIYDKSSFRIEGNDGEFESICQSLGLSGPEDFAIPTAAWESRRIRSSSDLLPRSNLDRLESPKETEEKETAESVVGNLCDRFVDHVRVRDEAELTRDVIADSKAEPGESSSYRSTTVTDLTMVELAVPSGPSIPSSSTRGIKGVRPPLLKPPPAMTLPSIDATCSTWDLMRDFAPIEANRTSLVNIREVPSSSDEEEEGKEQEREVENAISKREEDAVLSESCSFTTSNDDDCSSTTTEPMNISPNGRFRRTITSWEKGDLLGRGSFGSVYEGIADGGFFFAVKEVSLLDQGTQGRQSIYQLEQEIALLSQFEHENIVRYYGTDTDESKLYIFLELVTKGSLLNLYQKYHLKDSQVSSYTRQILHGLMYLHERNVVHRDVKCANILVDANGSVKLADFGLAKATKLNDVKSCKGTAFWMAPEVVNNKNQGYGLPADIWSLGCTVLEMLTHQIPYSPLEHMQALFRIGKGIPPPIPEFLSKDAQDFIMQCLQVNPKDRPSAPKLLDHPFVKRPQATPLGLTSPHPNRWI